MIKVIEVIKNKLTKPKLTNDQIISMGSIIIGKEITLKKEYPYNKIIITSVPGLRTVKNCEFVELIGTTLTNKTVSMVISIPTFKNIYNCSAAIDVNDSKNNIYIKDISK